MEAGGVMQGVSLGQPLCGREACLERLKPSPCGPEPRGSHDPEGHETQWSERPSAPAKGGVSSRVSP